METEQHKRLNEVSGSHWYYEARFEIFDSLLSKFVFKNFPTNNIRILDSGCGSGHFTKYLKQHGEVISLDISADAVKNFKMRHPTMKIVISGAAKTPFKNDFFDVIVILDVIEHIADDRHALSELFRILKPNGFLFINVPAFTILWGYHDTLYKHFRRYSKADLKTLVKGAGFSIKKITFSQLLLFIPLLFLRRIKSLLRINHDDFYPTNAMVNGLLSRIFTIEKNLLRKINLPFGINLICIAQKKSSP